MLPKFKEKLITDDTKWIIDQPDFNGMMHEFRFHETLKNNKNPAEKSKTTRGCPKGTNLNDFFNYLVDEPPESVDD